MSLSLDLISPYSRFYEKFYYDLFSSDNVKLINPVMHMQIEGYPATGQYMQDEFFLRPNDTITIPYSFYLMTEYSPEYFGVKSVLALPFKFFNTQDSIVHIYHSRGYINRLAFGLRREANKTKLLRIGGLSNEDKANKTHSYLNVIGKDGHWDCSISKVTLNNGKSETLFKTNDNTSYAYFDTTDLAIQVPNDFFKLLLDSYKEDLISRCKISSFRGIYKQLSCLNLDLIEGTISFYIEDFKYVLSLASLWFCEDDDYCDLLLLNDPKQDEWRIGIRFYDKFNVLFDYESKQIHFYSPEEGYIERINDILIKANSKFGLFLILGDIFIMLIGISLIISIQQMLKQNLYI